MMKFNTVALATLATVIAAGGPRSAMADVNLASTPMVSDLTKVVAPNVHFILDDSGSMNDDFMPDSVDGNQSRPCFRNFGYNKIYYNPATKYAPPPNPGGTPFTAATYTAAKVNGFQAASATTDLSATQSVQVRLTANPFAAVNGSKTVTVTHANHGLATGASVSFTNLSGNLRGLTLTGTFTITKVNDDSYRITSSTNANSTRAVGGASPPRANFSLPTGTYWEYVADPASPPSTCQADTSYRFRTPATAADQTNYANWYAYYRTRLNMMKSASGRAFATIGDTYRIGLDRINNRSNSNVMVNIKKFDAAQKSTWYTQLYGVTGDGYTPLRGALSKAGRLYAGKVVTGDNDPVQYKCQQNFAILTTDGYWNLQNEVNGTATTNYGPRGIDNVTLVGDQDGSETKHYKDAGAYQNTLADVAMYFYKTDLRDDPANKMGGLLDDNVTTLDVTPNDVQGTGDDTAKWQHMTTFALGLGVAGTLSYRPDYEIGDFGDYFNIGQGTKSWPNPDVTNNATELPARIDDLWHAAVNGRGRYLSASSPDSVIEELTKALATIAIKNGSAAAAATSTLEPVAGDQDAYLAQFTTEKWYGDLQARLIITKTGAIDSDVKWSARDLLTSRVGKNSDGERLIKTFDATGTNKLKDFTAVNLKKEIEDEDYFEPSALTQWGTWSAAQKSKATSEAMIDFIRGQTGFENEDANNVVVTPSPLVTSNENRLFRDRDYALGDIVNTSPVYVQSPPFNYGDAGYAAFKDLHRKQFNADGSVVPDSGRLGAVYVGANDGMLHAFRADTGVELWAYIPSAVVPNLYKLADAAYANNHQFYVDGPITVGDAYDGSAWKTVLVGGLGRGGKAYYALDVTDPEKPKALWEFDTDASDLVGDDDLGYSYGNAILTKRSSDGKWVVIFASGYNNNASGGDSKGRLYVVDAFTGEKLNEFETDSGADPDVSGIAKINNWVLDTLLDNVTRYVYGGDLGGSLWRFDLEETDDDKAAQLLGKTSATAGNQPITVKPELARIKDGAGNYQRVIIFGTGRYLGVTDLDPLAPSSAIAQAIYAVKDTGGDVGVFSDPGEGNLVEQTLVYDTATTPRKIGSPQPVDWATRNGWYMELPVGERVNVDPRLQLGTLAVVSNVPKDDYCKFLGESWLYKLNFATGTAVSTADKGIVGSYISGSLATGLTLIRLPDDKLVALVTLADTSVQAMDLPVAPGAGTALRRVGWREIF